MSFRKLSEIVEMADRKNKEFWEPVIEEDMKERNVSFAESFETMRQMLHAMKEADRGYDPRLRSASKISGGDGAKMEEFRKNGTSLAGDFILLVMEKAIKMGESNACMKRIVAAPTAGSCGVLPAVLLSYAEDFHASEEDMIKALYIAAGIGKVIAENAFIAGAAGGCQAEIGSASAMAAGALTFLQGGDTPAIINAATLSLKNFLGLVCDPVAGLVEVPCIKRNSYGAVNAATSAQLALTGITSAIAPDDVIDSMRRIGNQLSPSLKETSCGGLAVTESAQNY